MQNTYQPSAETNHVVAMYAGSALSFDLSKTATFADRGRSSRRAAYRHADGDLHEVQHVVRTGHAARWDLTWPIHRRRLVERHRMKPLLRELVHPLDH